MEQTAAGSWMVKCLSSTINQWVLRKKQHVLSKMPFIQTLNPCCKPLWITATEKRLKCKSSNQTPAISLPRANLHSDQETTLNVGGIGKHPGLWTVCQLLCCAAPYEAKNEKKRGRQRGRESIYMWNHLLLERETKEGKQTVYLNVPPLVKLQ